VAAPLPLRYCLFFFLRASLRLPAASLLQARYPLRLAFCACRFSFIEHMRDVEQANTFHPAFSPTLRFFTPPDARAAFALRHRAVPRHDYPVA